MEIDMLLNKSFEMTNGMILQEIMYKNKVSFEDLFPILGPKSIIQEIIVGKRIIKNTQIALLAKFLNTHPDVFTASNSFSSEASSVLDETDHEALPQSETMTEYPEKSKEQMFDPYSQQSYSPQTYPPQSFTQDSYPSPQSYSQQSYPESASPFSAQTNYSNYMLNPDFDKMR